MQDPAEFTKEASAALFASEEEALPLEVKKEQPKYSNRGLKRMGIRKPLKGRFASTLKI